MQNLGEIALLARLTRPTIAVVTNIGESHLEFLKTRKNIARAKGEIFKYLDKNDFAIINQDDEYFENLKKEVQKKKTGLRTFGLLEKADVTPESLKGIKLSLPGEHNIYNALAALAVARILKISKKAAKKALEHVHPVSKRMEVINRKDRVKIINDTYNASPQSMTAALKVLAEIKKERGGRTIAVLGDMLELGKKTRSAHRRVFALTQELKIDKVYTIGEFWPGPEKSKKLLIKKLRKFIRPRDIILVKGSRGLRLEEVANALR
jgi:UDP-N-acetylmuramoyl-tripeptide--D-alanyl-D-alanine ligase